MRMLASPGVFEEGPARHFALTPAGELFKTDTPGSLRYMAMMFSEEFSTRAYQYVAECLRTGGDGVTQAFGQKIWEVLAERPEQCETPACDDRLYLGRGRGDCRSLRLLWHRTHRRCRRWPRSPARLDPATLPEDEGRTI
jgi:hypothetical protein